MAQIDLGCVKTNTSVKTQKIKLSNKGVELPCAQHDLALMLRNSAKCFYARVEA
jgi:hypothetical protein